MFRKDTEPADPGTACCEFNPFQHDSVLLHCSVGVDSRHADCVRTSDDTTWFVSENLLNRVRVHKVDRNRPYQTSTYQLRGDVINTEATGCTANGGGVGSQEPWKTSPPNGRCVSSLEARHGSANAAGGEYMSYGEIVQIDACISRLRSQRHGNQGQISKWNPRVFDSEALPLQATRSKYHDVLFRLTL